jgi:putative chitinase
MINRKRFFDAVREAPFPGSLNQSQVYGMNVLLDVWERRFARDNPNDGDDWLGYALATTFHESAATMRPIEEYGQGEGKSYGEPTGPWNERYYGRGHVQLTWEENYLKAQLRLWEGYRVETKLHRYPDQMLYDDRTSALVLYDGMIRGWFTGVGLPDYFSASHDVSDPYNARKIVNGLDQAALIEDYYYQFRKALT